MSRNLSLGLELVPLAHILAQKKQVAKIRNRGGRGMKADELWRFASGPESNLRGFRSRKESQEQVAQACTPATR